MCLTMCTHESGSKIFRNPNVTFHSIALIADQSNIIVPVDQAANDIRKICESKCFRPDCVTKQTVFNVIGQQTSIQDDIAMVFFGSRFETSTVLKPLFTLIDLIVFLAGVVGIWLGLSFMHLIDLIQGVTNIEHRINICSVF